MILINEDYRFSSVVKKVGDYIKDNELLNDKTTLYINPNYIGLAYQKPNGQMIRGALSIGQNNYGNTLLRYTNATTGKPYNVLSQVEGAPEELSNDQIVDLVINGLSNKLFPKSYLK